MTPPYFPEIKKDKSFLLKTMHQIPNTLDNNRSIFLLLPPPFLSCSDLTSALSQRVQARNPLTQCSERTCECQYTTFGLPQTNISGYLWTHTSFHAYLCVPLIWVPMRFVYVLSCLRGTFVFICMDGNIIKRI